MHIDVAIDEHSSFAVWHTLYIIIWGQKRNCLFAYGEKVAILPKNLRKIVVFKEKVVSLQRKSGNIAKKSP